MSGHEGLLSAALVGVSRVDLPAADELPEPLRPLHAALGSRSEATRLLLLAGALDRWTQAGTMPPRAAPNDWAVPVFRPSHEPPPAPPSAEAFYDDVLNQRHTDMLPELLELTVRAGFRVPDHQLPHLLEYGAKVVRQRRLVLPAVGERGRWLAALNPKWRYAGASLSEPEALRTLWHSDPAGRASLLAFVRPRDPHLARRLVETVWSKAADAERREFLRGLDPALSPADEPFLERALDDRDSQVRRKAIDLLASIPDSRLRRRMTEAAGGLLTLQAGQLTPRFPAVISDSMVRDGVMRAAGSAATAQERARQLIQMLSAIPLAHWERSLEADPQTLIRAAQAGKWSRTLFSAFSSAAVRQRDVGWAEALLDLDDNGGRSAPVLPVLSDERVNERLEMALRTGDPGHVLATLRHTANLWDAFSGRLLLAFFVAQARVDPDSSNSVMLRHHARTLGHRLPVSLAEEASRQANAALVARSWEVSLGQVAAVLETRLAMHRALGLA